MKKAALIVLLLTGMFFDRIDLVGIDYFPHIVSTLSMPYIHPWDGTTDIANFGV
ncbi:hypothetical protein MASR2M39_07450 [Ignavibacteriales bacterium]